MYSLSAIAFCLFSMPAVLAFPSIRRSNANSSSPGTKGLNDYAKAIGKTYFGTASNIPGAETSDSAYMTILNDNGQFGQLTPTYSMKYSFTEPSRNIFTYTDGDAILTIAKGNSQLVRCHNLVWYDSLPSWLTSQTWDNATLISIMTNHIKTVVTHWGSGCYAWDVVNEALSDDGTYRPSLWYNTIGPAYIPIAFAAAAAAAPANVKLYYNDYNVEFPGTKASAAQKIISELKARGIRIDGIGLQSHFVAGQTPSQASQEQNMAAFAALGVDVAITELDIRIPLPATSASEAQQKTDFESTVGACVKTQRCVGVTLWDFDDKYSWLVNGEPGYGNGDPWDANLQKKSAYDGIVAALSGTNSTAS